jgi:hypothetical protein
MHRSTLSSDSSLSSVLPLSNNTSTLSFSAIRRAIMSQTCKVQFYILQIRFTKKLSENFTHERYVYTAYTYCEFYIVPTPLKIDCMYFMLHASEPSSSKSHVIASLQHMYVPNPAQHIHQQSICLIAPANSIRFSQSTFLESSD